MEEMRVLSGEPDLSMVDCIPWMELEHAYGSAIDVPDQFRSLAGLDAEVRRRTIFGFYSNLFHQGTVYSATIAAIPVFQHLLRYERVADKSKIFELLVSFAVPFSEEVFANIGPAEFIGGASDDSDGEVNADASECYLAVGAGVPLYELLLGDNDPRVVISAAFTLAFFPAHAFGSCPSLLAIARDDSQHAYVRSSALIATSYLGGGAVREDFLRLLRALIEDEQPGAEEPMSFLAAAAVYCLVRDKQNLDDAGLRSKTEKLALRCSEHGMELLECDFYRAKQRDDVVGLSKLDVDELFMPDPQFPWGDLTERIRRHTPSYKRPQRARPVLREEQGPDPASFDVKPDVFDRRNVIAAVRRLHAHHWGLGSRGPEAVKEFEPFQPHLMLAWDEVLRLLDSDVQYDRWVAASMFEYFGPLDEAAVDQLIERLHRGDNNNLGRVVSKLPVSERQCRLLCERLCNGDFERTQYHSPRDDYRRIVIEHGTVDQIQRLFEEGEFKEKANAAHELLNRGQMELSVALPVFAEALGSGDYGLTMSAKWMFAEWTAAHRWFLESYESLPQTHQWAIADAMCGFHADLTEQQDELFAQIDGEKNPVVAAKLVRLAANFKSPQSATADRLLALIDDDSSALLRVAIVDALGNWIGKDLDEILGERLKAFTADSSSSVRRAAIDHLAKFRDRSQWNVALIRRSLSDDDPGNRRHAMWHLSRLGQLTANDAGRLLSPDQPDRLSAETLLSAATNQNVLAALDEGNVVLSAENRPLASSVWGWMSRMKSGSQM